MITEDQLEFLKGRARIRYIFTGRDRFGLWWVMPWWELLGCGTIPE